MGFLTSLGAGVCLAMSLPTLAFADCHFSPYTFFPDRNDHVSIAVTADAGSSCGMAFREGPGYKFTSADFAKAPPHGILSQTGPTAFVYRAFDNYRGLDSYAIKICAVVDGKSGCSVLTYNVQLH
jgi:hypothetical protein